MTAGTDRPPPPAAPEMLVGAALLALGAGVVSGAIVGGLLAAIVIGSADDAWGAIGGLFVGAVVGILVAGGGYAAALVTAARRVLPPTRRARAVLLTLAAQATAGGYGAVLLAVLEPTSIGWTLLLLTLGLTVAACGPAAFLYAAGPGQPWRAATAVAVSLALAAGLVVATANAIGAARTDEAVARLPLVLFDGTTADPDLPGWRRDVFSVVEVAPARTFTDRGTEATLKYFTDSGPVVFLTMHTDVGDCADTAPDYTCDPVGSTKDGQLRHYQHTGPHPAFSLTGRFVALVYPDTSAVSVTAGYGPGDDEFSLDQASAVLAALRRVDRDTFEDRVGAELKLR